MRVRPSYTLRPYQQALVDDVVADLNGPDSSEVVLAACPGAGKTMMSIDVIRRQLDEKKAARVLVLAHATKLLRDQYIEKLREARPRFTFDEYLPRGASGHRPLAELKGQVVVGLPQSLSRIESSGFDLVVVDEAHLYYGQAMVTKIIKRCGAKRVLLLTGTPAPFVARGLKLHTVTLLDIYRAGFVADPVINHVESRFKVSRRQYNSDGEIRQRVRMTGGQTTQTLDGLLRWFRGYLSTVGPWSHVLRTLGKTIIVCRRQKVAQAAREHFRKLGVDAALSISDVDTRGIEIDRFKAPGGPPLLIVVGRANVGFDFPGLTAMVDMTGTINIDRIFQMLCRVVRPRNGSDAITQRKCFVKLSSPEMLSYTHAIMHASCGLADRELFEKWNGTDLSGVEVPVLRELVERERTYATGKQNSRRRLPMIDQGFQLFGDYFEKIVPAASHGLAPWMQTSVGRISLSLSGRHSDDDLLAFYERERCPVPKGHPLYMAQKARCDSSHRSFSTLVLERAREVGYKTKQSDPERRKKEIREFWSRHMRPLPGDHPLSCSEKNYSTPSCSAYDPNFHRELKVVRKQWGVTQEARLIGVTFGRLTVVARRQTPASSSSRSSRWLVRCECGAEKVVSRSSLKQSSSCGCYVREMASINLRRYIATRDPSSIRGERNSRSKLTDREARLIRDRIVDGTCKEVARIFDVSPSTIKAIRNGQNWSKSIPVNSAAVTP